MAEDKIGKLLKSKKKKSFQDLAQLLTQIDEIGIKSLKYKQLLNPECFSFRLGITGPPGAGKSTLITQLIQHFCNNGMSVGVLAVDPSSPFSGGALLGDRIRYQEALHNQNVFVRSIGSRGSLGGLSASAYLMLRAFDYWQFDIVLIETVGVGQTELEIMNVADSTAVVLVPESGDGIQMMKAGLMEIADVFVVNKSDRPGAQSLVDEIKNELHARDQQDRVPVFSTVASQNQGIEELAKHIEKESQKDFSFFRKSKDKIQAEAKALLRGELEQKITQKAARIKSLKELL